MRTLAIPRSLALLAALLAPAGAAHAQPPQAPLDARYRDAVARILGAALVDEDGWRKLAYLTTEIGHRLAGSPQLERAIAWAAAEMRREGLENVRLQPVKVPHWVRGRESAEAIAPYAKPLAMLGLGGSPGTPPEGITASVVVVESYDELEALGRERVAGRIVLYNVPWRGYGTTVEYRSTGAAHAARLGAVAMLLRSVTPRSLSTPHTGMQDLANGAPPIPAAAIAIEDAEWIHRLVRAGHDVRVRLRMEARLLPDADSSNVIAELAGRETPEEIVVLGGHFDSWDVGQGAEDDGSGCAAAWQAVALLKKLGLRPRRTIRLVLWTAEEVGIHGGRAYRDALGDGVSRHVAAIEMDGGAERPLGFGFGLGGARTDGSDPRYEAAYEKLRQIGRLLRGLDAGEIFRGGGGADISFLMRDGVPGLGLRTVGERYFDWHHTHADTLDKIDPQHFRKAVAMLAVMAYVLADMPERLSPAAP